MPLKFIKQQGKLLVNIMQDENFYESPYDIHYFVLNMDREKLYERINLRVDIMMEKGLLDECIKLKEMGYNSSMQSSKE